MPLREFTCRDCRHAFEELVSEGERPRCPACGGRHLTRRLSAFAVTGGAGKLAVASEGRACGSCGDPRGPGACDRD